MYADEALKNVNGTLNRAFNRKLYARSLLNHHHYHYSTLLVYDPLSRFPGGLSAEWVALYSFPGL